MSASSTLVIRVCGFELIRRYAKADGRWYDVVWVATGRLLRRMIDQRDARQWLRGQVSLSEEMTCEIFAIAERRAELLAPAPSSSPPPATGSCVDSGACGQ